MSKDQIIKELTKVGELLKDFNKFKHLFSKDEGEKTLAELRTLVNTIRTNIDLADVKRIEVDSIMPPILDRDSKAGQFVSIRPVSDMKTYLGIYLGDLATSFAYKVEGEKFIMKRSGYNPAIFVPDLKKVVFGFESWWGEIESEEHLRQITNEDINNVWYVKALKQIQDAKKEHNSDVNADARPDSEQSGNANVPV